MTTKTKKRAEPSPSAPGALGRLLEYAKARPGLRWSVSSTLSGDFVARLSRGRAVVRLEATKGGTIKRVSVHRGDELATEQVVGPSAPEVASALVALLGVL